MTPGKRWTVHDRAGNPVYLTEERWRHITDPFNHPELAECEEHIKAAIRKGRRRQEPLNPRKYRYVHPFGDLPGDFNYVVVIVLFGYSVDENGMTMANNFVATAFAKYVMQKG